MALSGGVDSTAAARILIEKNYDVTGVTLDLQPNDGTALRRARQICRDSGIAHRVVDLRRPFEEAVIARYIEQYRRGLTPNPCMMCNRSIKFGLLYDLMLEGGYDYLATGHYAQTCRVDDDFYIKRAPTHRRDQSYFLYHLSSEKIARLLFPVGHFSDKAATRDIARRIAPNLAEQAESVGVCFINRQTYDDWLSRHIAVGDGPIVDLTGRQIGRHRGFYRYTIGQKKGLPDAVGKGECVLAIEAANNRVVVGPEQLCYTRRVILDNCHFSPCFQCDQVYDVKIFNWGHLLQGRVRRRAASVVELEFTAPVRAVARGQYAVFYSSDLVVGGGRIIESAVATK